MGTHDSLQRNTRGSAMAHAVVFDFGGVLTSSVTAAFAAFGEDECGDPTLPLRLFAEPDVARLLSGHEEGRLSQKAFEEGLGARLSECGADVPAAGWISRLLARLEPDHQMIDLVARLRDVGVPVALLSNSLGDDCYRGYDLDGLFDAVVKSGEVGVRKPSRRAFARVCDRLGTSLNETVMVDDLPLNIRGAEKAGMIGVLHRSAPATEMELAQLLDEGLSHAAALRAGAGAISDDVNAGAT